MEFILIIGFIILGIYTLLVQGNSRERKIHEKIRSMGGEVLKIEYRTFFTGIGPFMVVGKGRAVYRIEYVLENQFIEGWVRFGSLFGPEWRL